MKSSKTKATIAWIFLSIVGFTAGSILQYSLVYYTLGQVLRDSIAAVIYSPLSLTLGLVHEFQFMRPLHLFCLFGGVPLWAVSCIGIYRTPRISALTVTIAAGLVGFTNAFLFWTMMGV